MAELKRTLVRTLRHPALWTGILLVLANILIARPGGGSSYSGGGSSSGGGGGSGDGDIGWLIYLVFRYPHIAIPVIVLFILYRYWQSRNQPQGAVSSSGHSADYYRGRNLRLDHALRGLQDGEDPNFSKTLFLDFAQHMYYQFHHWRSRKEFLNLAPYIGRDLLQETHARNSASPVEVSELVIGSVEIEDFDSTPTHHLLTVFYDANYTETRNGHSNRFIVKERWTYRRARGVASKGPQDMGTLHCPNCGAGLELTATGSCQYCGTVVTPGKQHWELVSTVQLHREVAPSLQLGHYAAEVGTDLPTFFDPNLQSQYQAFIAKHGIMDAEDYARQLRDVVVKGTFTQLYAAWSQRDWEKVRPLTTDFLFQSQRYWIDAYKKAGVINKLDELSVQNIQLVKMESDIYFDAITVRIFAAVKDYVVDEKSGKLIGGNRTHLRRFSEYWTFIRSASSNRSPAAFDTNHCPNCGAPVNMGQAGICKSCNTKVTTGEFDWVLSRITQDEAYKG